MKEQTTKRAGQRAKLREARQRGQQTEKQRTDGHQVNRQYVRRQYKDTVFRMLFKDKERLLELYNAVSGSCLADPEALENMREGGRTAGQKAFKRVFKRASKRGFKH